MHNLYCMPLGDTMRDQFTRSLAEAIRAGKGDERVFLLPSAYLLTEVRKELEQLLPIGHQQPKLLTFDEIVKEIVGLTGADIHFMTRLTQELLVKQILDELAAAGELTYFSTIAAFPGYVSTVTSLLAEIKRTGTTPEEFAAAAEARDWPVKDREMHAMFSAYQAKLTKLGLADLEEIYFLAINALKTGLIQLPYGYFCISEFYILSPLQLELVQELKRVAAIDIGLVYEKGRPEVYAAVEEDTYGSLVGMGFTPSFMPERRKTADALTHIRRNLYRDEAEVLTAAGVSVVSAPNRAKALNVVAGKVKRLLLEDGYSPTEIAVVVRDTAGYTELRQVFAAFGVPVSLARDERLADQPLTSLVSALLTARADGGTRHTVLNLLKSELTGELGIDAEAVEGRALKKVIRNWGEWGEVFRNWDDEKSRQGFNRLRRMVQSLPERATCSKWAETLKKVVNELEIPRLLGNLYKAGAVTLPLLKAGLSAYEALWRVLDDMANGFERLGQAERIIILSDFQGYLRQAAAAETLRLEHFNPDGVQVVSPAGVRGTTFRAVFVLGLTDGEFPQRQRENWLYDERERSELADVGIRLSKGSFRRAEEDLFFAVAAALAEESLTLVYHADAVTLPSPYVNEMERLFAEGTVDREEYEIGEIFPADYGGIFSPQELIGRALTDQFGGNCSPEAANAAAYVADNLLDEDFLRRVAAETAREQGEYGPYSGAVAENAITGAQAAAINGYSITALEDYAQCPFHYFATRILKLDEWEEQEEEAGFDVIGTLYHETLAAFLRRHAGSRLKLEQQAEYRAELDAILAEVCVNLAEKGKIVPGKAWDFRQRRLADVLHRWLAGEIAEQNAAGLAFLPRFLEWGFGLPLKDGMDAASVVEPLVLELDGRQVAITGKVDRVDAAGGKLAVVDYKRKSSPDFHELKQGIDLQVALYIMAVENLLCGDSGEVAGGGYYSVETGKKDGGMWRAELAKEIRHRASKKNGNLDAAGWRQQQDEIRSYVSRYIQGMTGGDYAVNPVGKCPPFCVAREICRFDGHAKGQQAGGEVLG